MNLNSTQRAALDLPDTPVSSVGMFPLPYFEHSIFPGGGQGHISRTARKHARRVEESNGAIEALNWCTNTSGHVSIAIGAQRSALRHVWDCVRESPPLRTRRNSAQIRE